MNGFCPLASGSKGNCIFVGTPTTRILIDAGISASAIEKRLQEIDVSIDTIQAVFVTHEHTDHIRGIAQLSKKFNMPVISNGSTAKAMVEILKMHPHFKVFTTGESFSFGDLEVHPFTISHDAVDPVAFTIRTGTIKMGFCTDLGYVTSLVRKTLEGCHTLYLEANHEPSMVHASPRPDIYKQRVLGRQGHLSNEECAQLLLDVMHDELRHIHLAHLSSECNSEEVALYRIKTALASKERAIPVTIAYQDRISHRIDLFRNLL